MEALDNKCPSCGAKIVFNPKNQMWDCDYCGSKFTLEEMKNYKNASSVKIPQEPSESVKKDELDIYRCKNCGAEIMADQNTTATFCVYCGSTAILKEKIEEGRVPNYIIPFKNVKEDAVKAFKDLVKKKPLVPKLFKKEENIQKITGVYIPFWAYDLLAEGNMEFSAVDIRHWSDSRYYYTETRRYEVINSGHLEYNKVLADASSRFDDDLMDSLEPFDYSALTNYNHAYLSGFLAEKYDVELENGYERAQQRTMNTCIDLMKSKVGHGSSSLKNNNLKIDLKNSYYILLPVWMVNLKYNNKTYTFAMNGQTGKIIGNLPVGMKETIIWFLLVFIICFMICIGCVLLITG